MDVLSHVLIGTSVINRPDLFFQVSLLSVLPDVIMWVPSHVYMVGKKIKQKKNYRLFTSQRWWSCPEWVREIYNVTHSFLFGALFSVYLYVGFREMAMPLISAWWLHIGVDLFTHSGKYAVKPFYPFTSKSLPLGFNWFHNAWYMAGQIGISLVIFCLAHFGIFKW